MQWSQYIALIVVGFAALLTGVAVASAEDQGPDVQMSALENPSKRSSDFLIPDYLVDDSVDKRGGLFRFGKRGSLFRFGKRGSLFRFGKRGGALFRFGRSGYDGAAPYNPFELDSDKRSFHWGRETE
ncbi:uncharacterized protein LOC121385308 [Gigantopelta aegis]|uniref:uncharacterized protein LOC121385308 n=1 Tax=Gigantopelta aegis TaxID=1735272 RepID=UPI001B88A5FD|nr:uncharacterized protein LOC121385308 [Gigantopelta aegis]